MELLTPRLKISTLKEIDFPEFEKTLNEVQRTCLGGSKNFFDWIISQYNNMDIINGLISLGMFDKKTGELLGTVGVGKHDDLHEPEIFYQLRPEFRGTWICNRSSKSRNKMGI